jgi:hypothetical protein
VVEEGEEEGGIVEMKVGEGGDVVVDAEKGGGCGGEGEGFGKKGVRGSEAEERTWNWSHDGVAGGSEGGPWPVDLENRRLRLRLLFFFFFFLFVWCLVFGYSFALWEGKLFSSFLTFFLSFVSCVVVYVWILVNPSGSEK